MKCFKKHRNKFELTFLLFSELTSVTGVESLILAFESGQSTKRATTTQQSNFVNVEVWYKSFTTVSRL